MTPTRNAMAGEFPDQAWAKRRPRFRECEGVVTNTVEREHSFTLGARKQKRPPSMSWTGESVPTTYTS
ncbi:MAG: hypothetical protein HZB45_07740 [Mycolicibacterium rufum]|nr:hypothetical protein [Mycolicibacterium rufum]